MAALSCLAVAIENYINSMLVLWLFYFTGLPQASQGISSWQEPWSGRQVQGNIICIWSSVRREETFNLWQIWTEGNARRRSWWSRLCSWWLICTSFWRGSVWDGHGWWHGTQEATSRWRYSSSTKVSCNHVTFVLCVCVCVWERERENLNKYIYISSFAVYRSACSDLMWQWLLKVCVFL